MCRRARFVRPVQAVRFCVLSIIFVLLAVIGAEAVNSFLSNQRLGCVQGRGQRVLRFPQSPVYNTGLWGFLSPFCPQA